MAEMAADRREMKKEENQEGGNGNSDKTLLGRQGGEMEVKL